MLRSTCAVLALMVVGCSDPAADPVVDDACANRITYEQGDSTYLIGSFYYDDAANIVKYVETNSSGKEVLHLTRSFDAQGRRIRQLVDTLRFEPNHREMTWEYDDEGRVSRTVYDGWSSNDLLRETRFFHDEAGRLEHTETDENGVPIDRVQYVYIDGDPSIMEVRHYDPSTDTLKYGFRYELLQDRWLSRSEIFNVEVVQTAEIFTYEDVSIGKLVRRDLDLDADATINASDAIIWSPEGRVERVEYDVDGDGLADEKRNFTYDAAGNLVLQTTHQPEHWVNFSTTFSWDDVHLSSVERKDETSGTVVERWSFEYGCSADLPMDVPVAPIQGFRVEMQTLAVEVDTTKWWKSFEMM